MNILYYLLKQFLKNEYVSIIFMILLSIAITIFQTISISYITAIIIHSIESNNKSKTMQYMNYFVLFSVVFLFIYYWYKVVQNNLLTKMTQWIKREIFNIILLSNNENMNHVNFVEFITPITRISISCYALLFDCITVVIPTIVFLIMISLFFFYVNPLLGAGFFTANCVIFLYIALFWESLSKEKNTHEVKMNENEKFIIDILNNIDKVISRGQNQNEMNKFSKMTEDCINSGILFLTYATNHVMVLNIIISIIIFACAWFLISLYFNHEITSTIFITLFTILLLYREKILATIQNIPDYLEFIGRLEYIIEHFNKMLGGKMNSYDFSKKKYSKHETEFDTIIFENVDFVYSSHKNSKNIFEKMSIQLDIQKKVIGISGFSGKGKSSFAKLILRLYEPTSGDIYIDDVNIKELDPNYIRKNIVYISQNSKLFDKKIIENIHYGCNDLDYCKDHIQQIMQYDKIRNLFKNIDIENDSAESLGENLSGGQRQVVNILSGLINPAKILILDEPTNALDAALKKEVISLINHYRKYKKCIIVITHDRDMYSIFDKIVYL